jgi:hypothetical protein
MEVEMKCRKCQKRKAVARASSPVFSQPMCLPCILRHEEQIGPLMLDELEEETERIQR